MTKAELFNKYTEILHGNDVELVLNYLFDFFSTDQLNEFLYHIYMEKGLDLNKDDDEE